MRKRIVEILVLVSFLAVMIVNSKNVQYETQTIEQAYSIEQTELPEKYVVLSHSCWDDGQDDIRNEIMYGEIELLAQLIRAEAGNQDYKGKQYVADVVLNRVQSKKFPDKIEDVIFQDNQFSVIKNGAFEEAGWTDTEEDYQIALNEYVGERLNSEIIYFRTDRYSDCGKPAFKYGNHYFSR